MKKATKKRQDSSLEKTIEKEPIAIIGIGCRFPGGVSSPDQFWSLLSNGIRAISEIPSDRIDLDTYYDPRPATPGKMMTRWGGFLNDIDQFDAYFFGISPREAERLDPQQRLLLEVGWEALEDSGTGLNEVKDSLTGVFIGLWLNDFESRLFANPGLTDFYMTTGSGRYSISGRLSYFFGMRGPSITIDTACSSSLVAIHLACQSLWNGESSIALAGGANIILQPHISIAYSQSKMMAPDGLCKFGDAQADGYVRSEGAAIIVLKPLSRAITDKNPIYALIRGGAVNNDGQTGGFLATPGQKGQEEMLRLAYQNAGIDPRRVQYIEAHGTGTRAGDPIELGALGAIVGAGRSADDPCLVGSVKTNLGHTEGAAGVAGLIKVALSLKNKLIPPSLNLTTLNPSIPWNQLGLTIPKKLTPWPATEEAIAGVSAFGIAGTNAHIVLSEWLEPGNRISKEEIAQAFPLALSAHTPEALQDLAELYARFLTQNDIPTLSDICYTANCRRTHHAERLVVIGKSHQELAEQLSAYIQQKQINSAIASAPKIGEQAKVAFVFPGQGSQWLGMGRELFRNNQVFGEVLQQCEQALKPWVDWSLLEQLSLNEDAPGYCLDEISVVQPTLFAIQIALAAVWRSLGIEPSAVIGHSMGEVAAAYVAGALTLEDAARVICQRSQLMQRTSGQGAMAVVGMTATEATETIKGYEDKLSIAVHNSPRSVVLSGEPNALETILDALRANEVFCRPVKVDVASHSPQMEPLRPELVDSLEGIKPQTGTIPFYSTVTQDVRDGSTLDAEYWGDNLRQPVQFANTIQKLIETDHIIFIEMSPHPILLTSIQEISAALKKAAYGFASLRREQSEMATILGELGALYRLGYPVDWNRLFPSQGHVVSLPPYPWQRQHFWFNGDSMETVPYHERGKVEHPLLGHRLPNLAHLQGHYIWQNKFSDFRQHFSTAATITVDSVYRDIALTATSAAFGQKNHTIRQITLYEPISMSASPQTMLQVNLIQNGAEATFQIFSQENEKANWLRHAEAQIQIGQVDLSWFYDIRWENSDLSASNTEKSLANQYWLILADQMGVGENLATKLSERGATCKVVFLIENTVNFEDLLIELQKENSVHIVYLWGLDFPRNEQITPDALSTTHASNGEVLLRLVQAVIRRDWVRMPALSVVTQGAQPLTTEEPQLFPSVLWGLGRIIALEQPKLWHALIDLPANEAIEDLTTLLLAELCEPSKEDQVAYRTGGRYVPRLVPVKDSGNIIQPFRLSADRSYLITGGLGMLGIQLSKWLISQGARHIVLTSRTGLPDRDGWPSVAPDTTLGKRISAVRALEESGAQIIIVQADVADETAMRQLFNQFGTSLPMLQGVIHAAGVNASQTVAEVDVDTWRDVLKPKTAGAWILHQLTVDLSLDFFVCFSSATSVWGSQGMAAYSAANHFLDQLAHYRHARQLPAVTINWGWWAGEGIATSQQMSLFSAVGLSEMPVEKGMSALLQLIETNTVQQTVAAVDWTIFKPIYESKRERPFLSSIKLEVPSEPSKPVLKAEGSPLRQQLQALPTEKQKEMLVLHVGQLVSEILGFTTPQSINERHGFFKMGMDSLMTVQLRARLEASLDCLLPPTIAFEYPTIAELVAYLLAHVLQQDSKAATDAKATAEIQVHKATAPLDALSEDELLNLLDNELSRIEDLT